MGCDDLGDLLKEIAELTRNTDDFIDVFCQQICYGRNIINSIVYRLEKWLDDNTHFNVKDDWKEEYLDDDGNILPEYEDDEYVKHIVETEGEGDWIYEITGVEPEDGF